MIGNYGGAGYFDFFAGAPWLYNPALNRGAFAWEISNDDNTHDLVNAMNR